MNEQGILVEWYWQDNWNTGRKTCPITTLSTTNPTWAVCLHSDRLVTNCLSHGPHYPDYNLGNCHCFGDWQATGAPSELTKLKYWHFKGQTRLCHRLTIRLLFLSVSQHTVAATVHKEWQETWGSSSFAAAHSSLLECVMLCCWPSGSRQCDGSQCHYHGLINCVTLNTKALWSFRVSRATCPIIWHHILLLSSKELIAVKKCE